MPEEPAAPDAPTRPALAEVVPSEAPGSRPARSAALRPDETVHKLLLSTPAHFIAEYEGDDVVLTHAWDMDRMVHGAGSPLNRTFLMLTFATPMVEPRAGSVVPDYSPTGDILCALLSVLYGKRFDHHGAVEMTGRYQVPNLDSASDLCDPARPYHGPALRADHPVPLDLREARRFETLIHDDATDAELGAAFSTAALFYARALRAVGRDPEVAYLHLVTACERLAEVAPLEGVELEAEISTALSRIEAELVGGARIAKILRARMRQLKRRFAALITTHLDDGFFVRSETVEPWQSLRADDFPRSAAAAYDLRSRYVHTGASFGNWIRPRHGNAERQVGQPVVLDRQMAKILARAPTFIGLERLTRLVLLRTAERLGADLSAAATPPAANQDRAPDGGLAIPRAPADTETEQMGNETT